MSSHAKRGNCALCERHCDLTLHHLIPRKLHRRNFFKKSFPRKELQRAVMLCRECHSGLHKLYDEMTLGKRLNTLERLKADPAVVRHAGWVARQKRAVK